MIEFFDMVSSLLSTVLDLVINFFHSVITLFTGLFKSLEFLLLTFAYLPPFVAGFLYLTIAVAVVYVIINRKGNA